ncbi:hypothetical protein [Paenibacillus sp. ISL-20]|uniref:hypothetical protein n=1 Tax=Paenibacillus sp. ISL-20 TaxID=2819163 RepID=UPI001BE6CED0|nr:hypothetical protein [Paenibacillus sp. ISL-20]
MNPLYDNPADFEFPLQDENRLSLGTELFLQNRQAKFFTYAGARDMISLSTQTES